MEKSKSDALQALSQMGAAHVISKLGLKSEEKKEAVHELARMGYKDLHDKLARKEPAHKD